MNQTGKLMQLPTHKQEQGAATMIVALLLLLMTSIGVFYMNRTTILDQKSSANQYRSTLALEAADAGIEWAIGMLNRPYDIQGNCTFDTTTNVSFRRKYVQVDYATAANITNHTHLNVSVAPNVRPGCYINNGVLSCSCPAPNSGDATLTPPSAMPGFTVSFAAIDATSVEVTSVGCSALTTACSATTASGADATATVKSILKLRSVLRAAPAAPLTCGGNCNLGGSFSVANTDYGTNGITVNAGTAISGAAGAVTTTPGAPAENSLVGADQSLASLASTDTTCSNASVFNAYFGSTLAQYQINPSVKSIDCTTANSCGAAVISAYNDGWRSFYFPSGFYLNNSSGISSLGTEADPVTIVSPSAIDINGNISIYGLVFSNDATYGDLGTGASTINGALVSCKDFKSNGNGNITYNAAALRNLQLSSALLVRVPGSWRDF